ncbi:MAG TPA: DEAD/DEAH box helicase [Acidobacteriota bacterium]|nr:DEAD/DEAH box helicase [Acidobacteriota bacterium]
MTESSPPPAAAPDPLAAFHPLVAEWFRARIGQPTAAQALAWPAIAAGRHVLLTAPTGSGKTLAAFLWAVNRFAAGAVPAAAARVLYVSPLKALGNDIRQNLERPLAELRELFAARDVPFPEIRVAVRTGDTDPGERRRIIRRPPEILITTPESLNILLLSASGRRALQGTASVILDEIHAVAGEKRGLFLMTAVERLALLGGEFQRVALSATVRPAAAVAAFMGGYRLVAESPDSIHEARAVEHVDAPGAKRYDLQVDAPPAPAPGEPPAHWWLQVAERCRGEIDRHRTTLCFANSRRLVERLTRSINESAGRDVAYSHHGALAREIRAAVEARFKRGELAAIVATSSLELGIDIGSVEAVVLVQPPYSVTSAVQRIGRAGHGVGRTSCGRFLPLHPPALVHAAATARAVAEGAIEPVIPRPGGLDVLAQVILAMTVDDARSLDELFTEVRCCAAYHDLERRDFERVVAMLAGRWAGTRLRELQPRLALDADGRARARPHVRGLLLLSGGVIPDRGYFTLRAADTKAAVGQLDEEFVWERSLGDAFPLGNQIWRITRITANEVEAVPGGRGHSLVPFWRAEEQGRTWSLAERIGGLLEAADGQLDDPDFPGELASHYHLTPAAAGALLAYLRRQREATGAPLPHRHHLLAESCPDPVHPDRRRQLLLHTGWGGRVNRPFALAVATACAAHLGRAVPYFVSDDCVLLEAPPEVTVARLLEWVTPATVRDLVRARLGATGYFGARFRECAGRALLLRRAGFRQRTPLWLHRLRAKELLAAVGDDPEFPILAEAWRECLATDFDLDALERLLAELGSGAIRVTEVATRAPSPFAAAVLWRQTGTYMYGDDAPEAPVELPSDANVLDALARDPAARPRLPGELLDAFQAKLHRLAPGYAPGTAEELAFWVGERRAIPEAEWAALLAAAHRDAGADTAALEAELAGRVARLAGPAGGALRVSATEADHVTHALAGNGVELAAFLREWLAFYGPVSPRQIGEALGVPMERVAPAVARLLADGHLVVGPFREPPEEDPAAVCDRRNLDALLRLRRREARAAAPVRPLVELPLFLAAHQGLLADDDGPDALRARLDALMGWGARVELWETEILPARLAGYRPDWLDALMAGEGLAWFGDGAERLAFSFEDQLALFARPDAVGPAAEPAPAQLAAFFRGNRGRFRLDDLIAETGLSSEAVTRGLWQLAWAGVLTNDAFAAVRRGLEHRFEAESVAALAGRGRRTGLARWRTSRPWTGQWRSLPASAEAADALERLERAKERVRLLLQRYGVVFRELLAGERPELRWGAVFPALRLMELSGEVVAGRFFDGVPGIQFAAPAAARALAEPLPADAVYWLSAADPASPCGLGLPGLPPALPARLPSSHVVCRGADVVLVSRRMGEALAIAVPPDDPVLPRALAMFPAWTQRAVRPPARVRVAEINGEPAAASPYAEALRAAGFRRDGRELLLERQV